MENLRKYIRESLKEAYINDDGELVEFDHKINYPHKKIGKLISYYIDSNFENWAKMGWAVFDSYYGEDKYNSETETVWRAEKIDNPEDWDIPVIVNLKDDSEAREKALEAGFEVDEDGVILGLYGITLVDKINESRNKTKRIVSGALIKDTTTNKVLLLKRNDKSPTWAMMTGEIDQGESALDGLEREMYEELFIKPGSVRLNYKGVEHILDKNIDLHYFEGFVNKQFKPILDEENLDYGWFSLEDLPSPLFGGIYKRIEQLLQKDNVYSSDTLVDKEIVSENLQQKNPNQLSLFEVRKNIRIILEQRIFSEQYLDEALSILSESNEPSPTFTWDMTKEDEPSPEFTWDLAKEKIDLSKKYVQTKEQAVEYLKKFFEKIKSLPRELKIRLAKYVVSGFVGLVGVGIISSLMSSTMPDVEKEVVKAVVVKQEPKKQEYVRPTTVSNELLNFLKHEEGSIRDKGEPVLRAYKLGDGAVTVGWGHAEKIRDTKLRPGQIITRDQAEAYFYEDVAEAKSYVDDMLNDWEKEGVKPRITQSMYDAMVSMVYNMGVGTFRFSDRSGELIKYLKTNQFDKASEEIKKVSAHLYNKFPGLETRRDAESEMFASDLNADDKSIKLAMNEVEIIDETYQGQKDLEKLASDSLKYLAEYIVYDSAYDFENNNGLNLPKKNLTSAIHTKDFIKNIDGYSEIKNFLEDINNITISFFKKEKPSSVEGSYNGSGNNRATINMFYKQKTLDAVNKLLVSNGYSYSDNLVHEVYFDLYHDLFSTLLHEFQHAYDDWRSKGKAFKFPKQYSEKDDVYRNIRNKEYSELSQEERAFADSHYEEYQNLMHEINARFAQTIKKMKFINITVGDGYEKTLAPWDEVLKSFKWNFEGWKIASDKRKRRLVQRLAKIYQEKGEDLIEEKNKNK